MSKFAITTFVALAAAILSIALIRGHAHIAVVAAIAVTYIAIFSLGMSRIGMQFFCPAVCRGEPGRKVVALTFDDGPDPAATGALLDLLRREKIPATFFLIGRHVAAHPDVAAAIAKDGHSIGNHTQNHPWWLTFFGVRGILREIEPAQRAIRAATGHMPSLFRPPAGLTNPHFGRALRKTGLTLVGWDVRPRDTSRGTAVVIDHVLRNVREGSIVLLHDGKAPVEKIVRIVEEVTRELRSRGYRFVTIDELIGGDRA